MHRIDQRNARQETGPSEEKVRAERDQDNVSHAAHRKSEKEENEPHGATSPSDVSIKKW